MDRPQNNASVRSLAAAPVQRGGQIIRSRGLPPRPILDLYHNLMTMSGRRLIALFISVFLTFNLIFAALYRLDSNGLMIAHDTGDMPLFWRDFFFSVHTVATIGYGNIYPASIYANVVVVAEITLGIIYFALATGIAFARFSRPTARILFSTVMVVRDVEGVPTLMLRAANQRHNMIYQAQARLSVLMVADVGGTRMRRFYDLDLVRASSPAFALTWMIMHPITQTSPLFSMLADKALADDVELVLILSGTDEVSGQTIHARWAYNGSDIRWGEKFLDVLGQDPDGVRTIDYHGFHQTEPD